MKIYHNSKCSKSRKTLALLKEYSVSHIQIINYLEVPPSFKDLELILIKLEISPIELVRTKEEIWKNNYKGQQITDDEIIKVLIENPKLIERPIVIKGNRAVIGRPPENVLSLLSQDGI